MLTVVAGEFSVTGDVRKVGLAESRNAATRPEVVRQDILDLAGDVFFKGCREYKSIGWCGAQHRERPHKGGMSREQKPDRNGWMRQVVFRRTMSEQPGNAHRRVSPSVRVKRRREPGTNPSVPAPPPPHRDERGYMSKISAGSATQAGFRLRARER